MRCYTPLRILAQIFPKKPLVCRRRIWREINDQLRIRGDGGRESGGFLIGTRRGGCRRIELFMAYDDVDPGALTGGISFDGSRMDVVWDVCRRTGKRVIADVHTHPLGYAQSGIDRANPMIPEVGHIALIIPRYADRLYLPGEIGIYELGRNGWIDHSEEGADFFSIRRFL